MVKGPSAAEEFFGRVFFAGATNKPCRQWPKGTVDAAGASQYADLLLTPQQQAEVT